MIELIGICGLIAFVVGSMAVGVRILLLAARTRLFPETTVGLSLFLAGGLGTALLILPKLLSDPDPLTPYILYQFGSAFSHVGFGLLFFFVWRVFRPNEIWAALLFGLCTAGLLVGGLGMAFEFEPGVIMVGRYTPDSIWFWLSLVSRFVGYCWASVESLRYYAMLKKRCELGLAEASVVSRFLFWGVSMAAVVFIWVTTAVRQVMAESALIQASSDLMTALLGFVVAGSLWYAFFPVGRLATASDDVSNASETQVP